MATAVEPGPGGFQVRRHMPAPGRSGGVVRRPQRWDHHPLPCTRSRRTTGRDPCPEVRHLMGPASGPTSAPEAAPLPGGGGAGLQSSEAAGTAWILVWWPQSRHRDPGPTSAPGSTSSWPRLFGAGCPPGGGGASPPGRRHQSPPWGADPHGVGLSREELGISCPGPQRPPGPSPMLDLLIRTGGAAAQRLPALGRPNAELVFTPRAWPTFSGEELEAALNEFRVGTAVRGVVQRGGARGVPCWA